MQLIITLSFLVIGLILEVRYRIKLYHSIKERIFIVGIIFLAFTAWELINIYYFESWIYPADGQMVGINIFRLPIELYIFYLTAPYFCFVVYEIIHRKIDIHLPYKR